MKILVTGGNGQLGRAFSAIKSNFYDIVCLDIDQMDFTNIYDVKVAFNQIKPDVVIHAGAYTDVDKAETEPDKVYKTNVIGTQNIASECLNTNIKMVYISTDYVFDGENHKPYTEFDEPNPLSIYAKSKLEGEKIATRICPKLFIVRTSWMFGDGKNFVKNILKLAKEKTFLTVNNCNWGSPTYSKDLAEHILELIQIDVYGIYHMSNKGQCSWCYFAEEIIKNTNYNTKIIPDNFYHDYIRPKYSVLRNYMLELTTGDKLRHWKDALKEYMKEINID